jgi:hypothetical protein
MLALAGCPLKILSSTCRALLTDEVNNSTGSHAAALSFAMMAGDLVEKPIRLHEDLLTLIVEISAFVDAVQVFKRVVFWSKHSPSWASLVEVLGALDLGSVLLP